MATRAIARPAAAPIVAVGVKRVSLLMQAGNYSFDGQGNKFKLLEQKFGCSIPDELMIEDRGYSGTDFNRPSIQKAKNIIASGRANAVAFPWLDRFARKVEGGLRTIREFRELGADVLLGDLGFYKDEGWFIAQMEMFMTIAEYQRNDIADKSRWGVQAKLKNGLAHYGAPYGWHMVTALEIAARALNAGQPVPLGKPQNYYERDLDALEVMRMIGEMALAGGRDGSKRGICRQLDAMGVKTPAQHRGMHLKRLQTGWNPVAIASLVEDLCYSTGIWWYGKREFIEPNPDRIRKPDADRHRVRSVSRMKPSADWAGSLELPGGGIWTPDEQAAIQEAIIRNGELSTGKPARPRSQGGRLAELGGLCTCKAIITEGERIGQVCGMAIAPWHGKLNADGMRTLYYRCTHRHKTQGQYLCDAKSVRGALLEAAVWERVKFAILVELDELIAAHLKEVTKAEDADTLDRLRAEQKHKIECRRSARKGVIEARNDADRAEYSDLVKCYDAEIALLERRILAAEPADETMATSVAKIKQWARDAFTTTDPADRRRIFQACVSEVRYAHGEAEIVISVGAVNCKQAEGDTYNKQPLQLVVKTTVAPPPDRAEVARQGWESQPDRSEALRKAASALSPEARRARSLKAASSLSPEERSAKSAKGWEKRRARQAA